MVRGLTPLIPHTFFRTAPNTNARTAHRVRPKALQTTFPATDWPTLKGGKVMQYDFADDEILLALGGLLGFIKVRTFMVYPITS